MNKISLINLGCARNLVDAQGILGRLEEKEFQIVTVDQADTVIINTCGFIKDAKQESIDAILDAIDLKKSGKIHRIIVAGCLSQRYAGELQKEFPEVDAFVGVPQLLQESVVKQTSLTPDYMTYLKVCESCYNLCAFCVIPKIKGRFSSRSMDSVLEEVRLMDRRGVKELNIIGQDTTAYGLDLYREKRLAKLLRAIAREVKEIHWIRLLYTFPSHITDELLDVIAEEKNICKYIDVPFQHVSDKILRGMNRAATLKGTYALVEKIRKRIPGAKIRSAFIVGFPGEGKAEFDELMAFVRWGRLDRVGVFTYSPEEGTPAFSMPDQIDDDVKELRRDRLMCLQQQISKELNEKMIGHEMEVLVEGYDEDRGMFFGRSQFDAPDVDGLVYIRSKRKLEEGSFVQVKIMGAEEYDLIATN
ncbi:MAG: 30S ribosomal protein S12 methylthiotransferase RimO [Candidatus Omnitrophota bacterium]